MTTFFVDTSAAAKRYLAETGSQWVLTWIGSGAGNVIIISDLTIAEMPSLFARRRREGTLSTTNVQILKANFLFHVEMEYLNVPLDYLLLTLAGDLVDKYPLRALDAIQLASAIRATRMLGEAMTFVSADHNLLTAAAAEGFAIDDPNAHP